MGAASWGNIGATAGILASRRSTGKSGGSHGPEPEDNFGFKLFLFFIGMVVLAFGGLYLVIHYGHS